MNNQDPYGETYLRLPDDQTDPHTALTGLLDLRRARATQTSRKLSVNEIEELILVSRLKSAAARARNEMLLDATIAAAFQVQGKQIEFLASPESSISPAQFAGAVVEVGLSFATAGAAARVKTAISAGLTAIVNAAMGSGALRDPGSIDQMAKLGTDLVLKEAGALKNYARSQTSGGTDAVPRGSISQSLPIVAVLAVAQAKRREVSIAIDAVQARFEYELRTERLARAQIDEISIDDLQVTPEALNDYAASATLLQEACMWAYKYEFSKRDSGTYYHPNADTWSGGPHTRSIDEAIVDYWLKRFGPLFSNPDFLKEYGAPGKPWDKLDAGARKVLLGKFLQDVGSRMLDRLKRNGS